MKSITATLSGSRWTSGMRRMLLIGTACAAVALSACGGGGSDTDRGPTTLSVSAELNGLYWDKSESRLFLTDDAANNIRAWDGGTQFTQYAALPTAPTSGATLGQLTRTTDGTLYVTRFGFGTDGSVVGAPKTGNAYNLSGTDKLRRRIGITTTPDGALLDGWFIKGGSGAVSELKLSGTTASERELITGLGKPVGLAVVGDTIYVSDQNTGNVLSYSLAKVRATPATLADGKVIATFTTLDGIDLMTAASDGTLFFGGSGGKLFRISPKGETSVVASGWPKIKGVAYDENHRRLFVAVGAADAKSQPSVRIVPID
ncbi:hypothetical protein G7048_27990 (plasmid) [Diaphorobacter sp. HDW4B]|uniref:hypothetical protein n=1 Tax=Diaphorobacter sp. HDW4B TaxID=2714925 RepID=UPI001409FB45|nr:hypothetical protein [Diaphorobacter sp. HDW4B]QIL74306.1 hypothetical protein G7048_27990 [Diaphorobacter sp. HDW4B]